jgi:hypothetical protein
MNWMNVLAKLQYQSVLSEASYVDWLDGVVEAASRLLATCPVVSTLLGSATLTNIVSASSFVPGADASGRASTAGVDAAVPETAVANAFASASTTTAALTTTSCDDSTIDGGVCTRAGLVPGGGTPTGSSVLA